MCEVKDIPSIQLIIHFSLLSDYMSQCAACPSFGCLNKTKYCVFKAISASFTLRKYVMSQVHNK